MAAILNKVGFNSFIYIVQIPQFSGVLHVKSKEQTLKCMRKI